MKSLAEFLTANGREPDVTAVTEFLGEYFRDQWRPVLHDNRVQLLETFDRAGEASYGMYWNRLTRPLRDQLAEVGLRTRPAFPGDLDHSVEEWGGPTERERCMWYVLYPMSSSTAMGTLVVGSFHDHTRFRVPRAPRVEVLEQTDAHDIVEALLG